MDAPDLQALFTDRHIEAAEKAGHVVTFTNAPREGAVKPRAWSCTCGAGGVRLDRYGAKQDAELHQRVSY